MSLTELPCGLGGLEGAFPRCPEVVRWKELVRTLGTRFFIFAPNIKWSAFMLLGEELDS